LPEDELPRTKVRLIHGEEGMHKTRNDLAANTRGAMINLLQARLADAIDLSTQTKQAHWNVKGPHFIGLHELFDDVHEHVDEAVDLIAERLVALGGTAEGTARVVAKRSSLDEYPLGITSGIEHCEALATALAAFGKAVRKAIDEAGEAGDQDTADLFTGVSRQADKDLWMVEAHLEGDQ
jgi:starvation-inducible DNA-binding protein